MNCPSNSEGITVPKENPPKLRGRVSGIRQIGARAEEKRIRRSWFYAGVNRPDRSGLGLEFDPGPRLSDVNLLPWSGCCHKPDEADDEADDEDDISEIDPKSTLSKWSADFIN